MCSDRCTLGNGLKYGTLIWGTGSRLDGRERPADGGTRSGTTGYKQMGEKGWEGAGGGAGGGAGRVADR